MDQPFSTGSGSPFRFSGLFTGAVGICDWASVALRSACASRDLDVLCASIAAYLMLGLMWTVAYWLVDQLTPGGAFLFTSNRNSQSIDGFTGFYFSFITLSTVGYGDITPVSRAARLLAAMEAMTGCYMWRS